MILEKYCILGSSTLTEVHIDISFKSTLIDKQKPWAHCFTFTSTLSSNLLSQTVWLKKKKKTWQMHYHIVLWIITACRRRRGRKRRRRRKALYDDNRSETSWRRHERCSRSAGIYNFPQFFGCLVHFMSLVRWVVCANSLNIFAKKKKKHTHW